MGVEPVVEFVVVGPVAYFASVRRVVFLFEGGAEVRLLEPVRVAVELPVSWSVKSVFSLN